MHMNAKKINPYLKSVNAQVLQQTLKTLDRAFSALKSKGYGFPRFKKQMRSFVFPAMLKNCLVQGKVMLPQLGWLKIKQSRNYPTGFEPKQARIVKKATGYYLMIAFQWAIYQRNFALCVLEKKQILSES